MSKRVVLAAVMVAAMAGVASAQSPAPTTAEQIRARQRISMMEGVLERAVRNGADNLLRQVSLVTSDLPMLTGVPDVRGFRLDGYGLFFDVGVPGLRPPITWQLRYFVADPIGSGPILSELTALSQDANLDPRHRRQLQVIVSELERVARARPGVRARADVTGAAVASAPAPAVEPDVLADPNMAYTREIKAALVDAMLENSGPLSLRDDEWLTVAARDNLPRDPLVPGDVTDFRTILLRIRGVDLAAFHARKITLEEARQRVQATEQ